MLSVTNLLDENMATLIYYVPVFESNYSLMMKNLGFFDKMGFGEIRFGKLRFFLNPYKTGLIVGENSFVKLGLQGFYVKNKNYL